MRIVLVLIGLLVASAACGDGKGKKPTNNTLTASERLEVDALKRKRQDIMQAAKAEIDRSAKERTALAKRHVPPPTTTPASPIDERVRTAREKVESVPGPHSNGGGK